MATKASNTFVIEDYPTTYDGLKFLTLLEFVHGERLLTIVDVVTATTVHAYVLDDWQQSGLDQKLLIPTLNVIAQTYEADTSCPMSMILARKGLQRHLARIYKSVPSYEIARAIGRVPLKTLVPAKVVKRRRRRQLAPDMVLTD